MNTRYAHINPFWVTIRKMFTSTLYQEDEDDEGKNMRKMRMRKAGEVEEGVESLHKLHRCGFDR